MKILMIIHLLIASQAFAQIQISKSNLDSLKFQYSLNDLIEHLQNKLPDVRDSTLYKQRSLQIMQTYYSFKDAEEELRILSKETDNLYAIYQLFKQKQKTSEASDLEVLQAHNNYLSRKFSLIAKQSTARNFLFQIARLLNLEIKVQNEQAQKKNSKNIE